MTKFQGRTDDKSLEHRLRALEQAVRASRAPVGRPVRRVVVGGSSRDPGDSGGLEQQGVSSGEMQAHLYAANPHSQYTLVITFEAHRDDQGNPHGVTAAQAGADPEGTAVAQVEAHDLDADAHPALRARISDLEDLQLTYIRVESVEDLAPYEDATESFYELPANSLVIVNGTVSIGTHYLQLSEGTVLRGFANGTVVSMNTGGVIRASALDSAVIMREVNIVAPAGPCLDLSGPITEQLNVFFCGFFGLSAGTVTGFDVQAFKDCFFSTEEGLTLAGATNKAFVSQCPFYGTTAGNAALTLGATLDAEVVDITRSFFKGNDGVGIRAETGYAVGNGLLTGSLIVGTMTPLDGIDPGDTNWWLQNNTGVADSMVMAQSSSTAADTVTITTQGTLVQAQNANALSSASQRFSADGASAVTYEGQRPAAVMVIATALVDPQSNNVDARMSLGVNGTPVASSQVPFFVSSGNDRRAVTVSDVLMLETGDVVTVWFANEDGTGDLEISSLNISFRG